MNDPEFELYKNLKEEFKEYSLHLQSVWKFKFLTMGAIISFLITNQKIMDLIKGSEEYFIWSLLVLPLLSFFLDLKILEISLHLRQISEFIIKEFSSFQKVKRWEELAWSDEFLVLFRRRLTILSTIATSLTSLIVTLIIIVINKQEYILTAVIIGIIGITLSVLGVITFSNKMKIKTVAKTRL